MRFPQFSLEILMAVVVTAEKKSTMRAGKELGISPSAVTKRIRVAERTAGAKLFHSAEEGLVLTQAGELLYYEAKKSIERALLGEEKVSAYLMLRERHLLVGHSTYLPPRLMAMLIQFRFDASPPVEIEHRPELTPLIVQQVLDGTLHVGFGFLPQEHPDLTVRQLYEEPLVACLPAGHPISAKHTIYPEDLRGQAFIAIGRRQMPSFQGRDRELLFRVRGTFERGGGCVCAAGSIGLCRAEDRRLSDGAIFRDFQAGHCHQTAFPSSFDMEKRDVPAGGQPS